MRVIRLFVAFGLLAAVGFAGPKDARHIRPLPLQEPVVLLDGTVIMGLINEWQSQTGNWNEAAGWALGVPTGTHIAFFDKASQVKPTLNIGLGQNGPASIVVTENFHGGIGGPGNYLNNVLSTASITIRGSGDYYLRTSAVGSNTLIDVPSDGYVELDGTALANLYVKGGQVWVTENSSFGDGSIVATYGDTANLTIRPSTGSTYPWHLNCYGGVLNNQDETDGTNAVRLIVSGAGTFIQEGLIIDGSFLFTTGGVFDYRPSTNPSGESFFASINGILRLTDSRFIIPISAIVLGPEAEVQEGPTELLQAQVTIDMRQDFPFP